MLYDHIDTLNLSFCDKMSSLRGYQSWATLGLMNDTPSQQKVLNILHNIRANLPNKLNLQSAPSCDRIKRATSRRICDLPGKAPSLHREAAVEALYAPFKICCSDWSEEGAANTEQSNENCEDRGNHADDSLLLKGNLKKHGTCFERLSNATDSAFATVPGRHDTHGPGLVEEYDKHAQLFGHTHADSDSDHQCISTNRRPIVQSPHEMAQNKINASQQRHKEYDWDWFNYQHANVIYNAFVDITWAHYPRCRETMRLSDLMGTSVNAHRTTAPFTRARHQDRSPDGDWIRLDSISLTKLHKQLQVIRSFDQQQNVIWWSSTPLDMPSIDLTEGQARIDNQRDLTWAVYRSFDARWQEWRGRRIAAELPS